MWFWQKKENYSFLFRCQVSAVLVVPVWPGASFFSTFWPDGRHPAEFVVKTRTINPFFECGPLVSGSSMRGFKSYKTVVMKIDFRELPHEGEQFCLSGGCSGCAV